MAFHNTNLDICVQGRVDVPDVWKRYKVWDLFLLGFHNVAVYKYNYIQHFMQYYAPSNSCHWTSLMPVPQNAKGNLNLSAWNDFNELLIQQCHEIFIKACWLSGHSIWYQHLESWYILKWTWQNEKSNLHVTTFKQQYRPHRLIVSSKITFF